ncbi:hypothetical protein ACFUCV_02925 [Specibacter sp. NPDC057265]|uniref:hypothetical protein n=1 Tax=Specibacter sp. NPDC057265 TaxID=3346075 RepID=UPI003645457C
MNVTDTNAGDMNQPPQGSGTTPVRRPKIRWRDALARERYLFAVDLHLDGRVPARVRKRILADLRHSIEVDAEGAQLQDVLAGLGKPCELAANYAEGADQSRPLWTAGVVAALCLLLVYWFFLFAFTMGMLAVTMQAGGEFHARFFFLNVMAFSQDDGVGIGWSGNAALWFPLLLAAIAFIPASRAWRVFGRRR